MLSIIVPIYNVQEYIRQCLDSILSQSYKDYNVILVDDSSNDNSYNICLEYTNKYSNFKVYQKENGGLSDARNYGLKFVTTPYITFLDSDDYLNKDTYLLMMKKIIIEDLDIVISDIKFCFDSNKDFILKGLKNIDISLNKRLLLSPMFAWNKIYRLSYFNSIGLLYPKGLWFEDIPITSLLFVISDKIGYINYIGYNYRQRNDSIMSTFNDKVNDIFIILEMVYNNFKDRNLLDKYYDEIEYLFIEQLMLYNQFRFIKSDNYRLYYIKSYQFMIKYYKNYKKNKYIKNLGFKNKLFIKYLNNYNIKYVRRVIK